MSELELFALIPFTLSHCQLSKTRWMQNTRVIIELSTLMRVVR